MSTRRKFLLGMVGILAMATAPAIITNAMKIRATRLRGLCRSLTYLDQFPYFTEEEWNAPWYPPADFNRGIVDMSGYYKDKVKAIEAERERIDQLKNPIQRDFDKEADKWYNQQLNLLIRNQV